MTKLPQKPHNNLDHYSTFNVRSHYQKLKENHPFYQQLHKPQQNPIKTTYL